MLLFLKRMVHSYKEMSRNKSFNIAYEIHCEQNPLSLATLVNKYLRSELPIFFFRSVFKLGTHCRNLIYYISNSRQAEETNQIFTCPWKDEAYDYFLSRIFIAFTITSYLKLTFPLHKRICFITMNCSLLVCKSDTAQSLANSFILNKTWGRSSIMM